MAVTLYGNLFVSHNINRLSNQRLWQSFRMALHKLPVIRTLYYAAIILYYNTTTVRHMDIHGVILYSDHFVSQHVNRPSHRLLYGSYIIRQSNPSHTRLQQLNYTTIIVSQYINRPSHGCLWQLYYTAIISYRNTSTRHLRQLYYMAIISYFIRSKQGRT